MPAPDPVASPLRRGLRLGAILLVALNLRTALASVGPLVPEIREGTGLSNGALGLLTTLPLLAFGTLSVVAAVAGRRLGIERAIALALLLVAGGTALRAAPPVALLFLGTGLFGVGVAVVNVLLPALAKRDFAHRSGPITGLYSGGMGVGAGLGAGLTVPLAAVLGWRGALGVWALPALVALLAWLPLARSRKGPPRATGVPGSFRALAGSGLAWQVAVFMGLQSLSFYVVLTWLPDILVASGLPRARAGWLLGLAQATGVAGTVLVALRAGAVQDQRNLVWAVAILEGVGLGGLLLPGGPLPATWVSLVGFAQGGAFGLALIFLVVRARDPDSASDLSGMAQSVGYLLAAVGPPLFGLLHDGSGGWSIPLATLLGLVLVKTWAGLGAGQPHRVVPGEGHHGGAVPGGSG
ncbi:MAG TPA: MFS transporter [Longimicrobiales bacterium]|nr:MFS transporter [Longimicrobiales bacterium]